jgi:hypothetical protein
VKIIRTLVNGGLSAARFPLTVAEVTLRRGDRTAEWPPAIAFESFAAAVKHFAGRLTHDDALADDARLVRAKVGQLRMGAELEALAESRQAEANSEFEARLDADAARRQIVSAQSAARERMADALRRDQERATAERLERKVAIAAEAEAADRIAAAKRERAARAKQIQAERAALAREQQAVAAQKHVSEIDAELETSKANRSSSESQD